MQWKKYIYQACPLNSSRVISDYVWIQHQILQFCITFTIKKKKNYWQQHAFQKKNAKKKKQEYSKYKTIASVD